MLALACTNLYAGYVFQNALETLEEHAEFRDGENDYSRALAFRRASCALKSLPFQVERISQVEGLKDFGSHVLRVMEVGSTPFSFLCLHVLIVL